MTNLERIKNMTLDEMAALIDELTPAARTMFILNPKNDGQEYRDYIKAWLEQEASK